jgi:hypothetical protein
MTMIPRAGSNHLDQNRQIGGVEFHVAVVFPTIQQTDLARFTKPLSDPIHRADRNAEHLGRLPRRPMTQQIGEDQVPRLEPGLTTLPQLPQQFFFFPPPKLWDNSVHGNSFLQSPPGKLNKPLEFPFYLLQDLVFKELKCVPSSRTVI